MLSALLVFLFYLSSTYAEPSLPSVDLGYEVHQAISYNDTLSTFNFSNIRFAQPPVGELRFALPIPPNDTTQQIQNGSVGTICPPSSPIWSVLTSQYAQNWAEGNASITSYLGQLSFVEANPQAALSLLSKAINDPRITEDCLFLDVVTPKKVFERSRSTCNAKGAPVVIYIFGGGYVAGDKTQATPDAFLLDAYKKGSEGFVWVAMNYRLGALGFLAGPSLQAEGGVSNAGLHDQALAIDWVQTNIQKFGGDPNDITIFGGSAGGGSVMHHITAYAGMKPAKFNKAIALYSGWQPRASNYDEETNAQAFLQALNTTTFEGARDASSAAAINASFQEVALSSSGTFSYGPSVDGTFSTDLPGQLLLTSAHAQNISILTSYNLNDGAPFAPPEASVSEQALQAYLRRFASTISTPVLDFITNDLYPAVYNGSQPYNTSYERVARITRDIGFACNSDYLMYAPGLSGWKYLWAVPPALHGDDFPSLQYTGPPSAPGAPKWTAELVSYFVNFILRGNPNGEDLPQWPSGQSGLVNVFGADEIAVIPETEQMKSICKYFQEALYI